MFRNFPRLHWVRLVIVVCLVLVTQLGIPDSYRGKNEEQRPGPRVRESSGTLNRIVRPTDDTGIDGYFVGSPPPNNIHVAPGAQTYQPGTPIAEVRPVAPTGHHPSGKPIWYINGIKNTLNEQYETMQIIADRTGQPVIGIHNSTSWWGADLGQSINDLSGFGRNRATDSLAFALLNELDADREVHLMGHSQGTLIINNAIEKVRNSLVARGLTFCQVLSKLALIKAELYGSPGVSFVNGPSYFHSCNLRDHVCNGLVISRGAVASDAAGAQVIMDSIVDEAPWPPIKMYERGKVYGGRAEVDLFAGGSVNPFKAHSINDVYLPRRASVVRFPVPPQCSANLFLMDTSGSMADGGKWDGALQSALESLKGFEDEGKKLRGFYSTAVLSFAGECSEGSSRKLFNFSTDIAQTSKDLPRALPRPNGGTPLYISYDVAWKVMDEFTAKNPDIREGSMIILTDGADTCGGYLRPGGAYGAGTGTSSAKSLAGNSRKNTRVFTVGYDIAPGSRGERDLQYMAFAGGGKYYNAANPRQLQRAFQKLTKSYYPRNITLNDSQRLRLGERINAASTALQKKRAVDALKLYRQLEGEFTRSDIKSAELDFNIAQALEASDLYRGAADYYQRYLQNNPGAPDKVAVEKKIVQLREDYRDQVDYYLKIIDSDLQYLKAYYKDLFNKRNDALAIEFAGFVSEKGAFYTNLSEVLEVKAKWLENGSKDLSDSLYNLSDRVNKPSFDRDAVSLLTLPISQLEDLLEQLNQNKSKLIN